MSMDRACLQQRITLARAIFEYLMTFSLMDTFEYSLPEYSGDSMNGGGDTIADEKVRSANDLKIRFSRSM